MQSASFVRGNHVPPAAPGGHTKHFFRMANRNPSKPITAAQVHNAILAERKAKVFFPAATGRSARVHVLTNQTRTATMGKSSRVARLSLYCGTPVHSANKTLYFLGQLRDSPIELAGPRNRCEHAPANECNCAELKVIGSWGTRRVHSKLL